MYEQLFRENQGLLVFWANRYAFICQQKGDIDVDDLIHQGFFALVEAHRSYQENGCAWSTWASFYICNAMRETLGLRGRRQLPISSLDVPVGKDEDGTLGELIPDETLSEADSAIIRDETIRAVRCAVDSIQDDAVRCAIQEYYLDGLSYARIAADLNIRINAVSGLLRKNKSLCRAFPDLDEITRFHAHKGVAAFNRDFTSVVEEAVIWREELRSKAEKTPQEAYKLPSMV